jgi:hypothetical protein
MKQPPTTCNSCNVALAWLSGLDGFDRRGICERASKAETEVSGGASVEPGDHWVSAAIRLHADELLELADELENGADPSVIADRLRKLESALEVER